MPSLLVMIIRGCSVVEFFLEHCKDANAMLCFGFERVKALSQVYVEDHPHSYDFGPWHTSSIVDQCFLSPSHNCENLSTKLRRLINQK